MIMYMKKYLIAIAVAAVSLASCSEKVEPVNGTDEAKYVPVEIASVEIPATKAVVSGTGFSDGASIGTFLFTQNSTSTPYYSGSTNVKYSKGSGNSWTSTTPLKVSATTGDLYAYYPYTDGVANITNISITNADDWMYAEKKTINSSSGSVSLTMKHALAYVEVTIKKTSDYVGTANLTKITFSAPSQTKPSIAASGTFNATSGKVSGTAADVSFTVGSDSGAEITTSGYTHDCLFIPTKADNTNRQAVKLTFKIGSVDKSIDLTGASGVQFTPGVKSTVTITLSPKSLTLESVGITDWTTGTSSSGTIDS